MGSHSADIWNIADDHIAVTRADEVIWFADELLAQAARPGEAPITGGLERNGDLISFGTPDSGLGRLTYRLIEHNPGGWHVAERQR